MGASDEARLASLAAQRANLKTSDNVIGPGDLVEINVFDLAEMNQKLRVSSSGFIQMPLIGAVKAGGRTEAELAKDIEGRLSSNYLQNPQVNVSVLEYQNQQVAVTGSVAKPGLYPLTRERYTILDMLSQAGGVTKDASSILEFIPATVGESSSAFEVAKSGAPLASPTTGESARDAITVDFGELLRSSGGSRLSFPLIAGDVIYVPESGSFAIEGWVAKEGNYPITRRMTVLGGISAAGGPLFPAVTSRVEILRASDANRGERATVVTNLEAVRAGREPDVNLRPGDVVRVPGSVPAMIPWGVYKFFESVVRVGLGATVGVIP